MDYYGVAWFCTCMFVFFLFYYTTIFSACSSMQKRCYKCLELVPADKDSFCCNEFQILGPLTWGPQCRMSHLRNGYVDCHFFHVDFKMVQCCRSNLRNGLCHVHNISSLGKKTRRSYFSPNASPVPYNAIA